MYSYRYEENPLITPADVVPHRDGFEVIGAFNAAATKFQDEILLLLRVAERPISGHPDRVQAVWVDAESAELVTQEFDLHDETFDFSDSRMVRVAGSLTWSYLTSLSYLRLARSKDGRHFAIDDKAFLYPEGRMETFGIEDPRITQLGDTYYITYSIVSPLGVGVGMASTQDFVTVTRHGVIFPPENKDVVLFPEQIGGKYYALHRPVPKGVGAPEIWIAESDNLEYWGNHRHLLGLREGHWDSGRIGAGAVPIKTEQGWLELYHAADKSNRYCMGAVLLDLNDPSKILGRTEQPILIPEAPYEIDGFFGNVVFSCGALVEDDVVRVYYGVADTSMACAELSLRDILAALSRA